ncbi:MAG: leucine-rich repeat protein [Oscillibacter sp.]|nr:leucine-rich repeat protein [Oscillibacter sp.]
MADVFISYKRSEDTSVLVSRIADELESMDISCWYDTKDPTPGYFAQTIKREIENCKVFLLIWDEGANNSEWCLTETHIAFSCAARPMRIPFQVGDFTKDSDMDVYMTRCQILNGGNSPKNANIKKLIVKIAAIFGKKPMRIIQRGSCGDDVKYTLDANGVLTIYGKEDMQNFVFATDIPWQNIRELVSIVRIQRGVTSIGSLSFSGCPSLTGVTISDSVTSINSSAFRDCDSLESIIIPDSVISIGGWAFRNCGKLTNVTIPDSVMSISLEAFRGCNNLKSVSVSSKTRINTYAFDNNAKIIRRK